MIKKVVIGSLYLEKIIIYLYLIVLVLEISQINYMKFIKIIILLQIYIEFKILIQIYVVCFVFYSVYTKLIQKINSYLFLNLFNSEFEGKRKDTSLVITRSFQYFFEHRHQL